jgi:outer membrane protein insertion porin family
VSGLAGSFIGLTYQTNNFLGLGETLTLSGQIGTIQRVATFGFTEPYLFDRPIATGFTVSTSRYTFNQSQQTSLLLGQKVQLNPNIEQNYNQNTTGFTVFASYPLRRFSFARLGLTYGYSDTSIQSFSTSSTQLFEVLQFQSVAGPSALSGIHSSKLVPSISYNTVDNPVNPTHGKSLFYSLGFEGLGGNVKAVTNVVEAKYFRPINHKRNVLAFHFAGAFAAGYGGLEVPPYERLYLGGENDLRGFDIRTISPIAFIPVVNNVSKTYMNPTVLGLSGLPTSMSTPPIPELTYLITFPGGDTSGVFNAEYRIPIVGPVSASLFTDVGAVGVLLPDQLQLNSTGVTNITTVFPNLPSGFPLSNRLQIQPGTNFKPRASAGIEFVVQLPIINAPFRIYWAYNFDRLEQQIIAHQGTFQSGSICNVENVVNGTTGDCTTPNPSSLFNLQVVPQLVSDVSNPQRVNFFEPKSTFRFTVSRTF